MGSTADVYRATYRDRHGKAKKAGTWFLAYWDPAAGRHRKEYGFQSASDAKARRAELEAKKTGRKGAIPFSGTSLGNAVRRSPGGLRRAAADPSVPPAGPWSWAASIRPWPTRPNVGDPEAP